MPLKANRTVARWAAPAAALAVVVAAPFVVNSRAGADAGLPPRTSQQLLVDLQSRTRRPLSGEVTQTVNLGLPALPGGSGGQVGAEGSLGTVMALASGTHTWRVWTDGATSSRLALVDGSSETAWIRNGADTWVWSSSERKAVHHRGDAGSAPTGPGKAAPANTAPTTVPRSPDEAADQVLKALDPTTEVTTDGTDRVAGRAVYQLVLTPRTPDTRIGRIRLAVDAETKQALRVQVLNRAGQPAVDVGFTSVTYDQPDPALFRFTPPPGAEVSEAPTGQHPGAAATSSDPAKAKSTDPADKPKIVGTGWSTVVVTKAPDSGATPSAAAPGSANTPARPGHPKAQETRDQAGSVLQSLPEVSGSWGRGRLLDGTLVSVVIADDGRVAVGAVEPEALYRALSQ